ncbi:hypothetical protein [Commensalibacter melissae]|uniref:hypothetical protein n=1 Tax=Commensalibacter melissae TaxID=2070537 RepID=UPI0012D9E358|nr:hypothetical protein [Commensalibacter melissae]MUG08611.1 hypothetical protein [Commensalibacter melissae]
MIQVSCETGRYIYHIDGIRERIGYKGENIIQNHIDKVMGRVDCVWWRKATLLSSINMF